MIQHSKTGLYNCRTLESVLNQLIKKISMIWAQWKREPKDNSDTESSMKSLEIRVFYAHNPFISSYKADSNVVSYIQCFRCDKDSGGVNGHQCFKKGIGMQYYWRREQLVDV
eukprot:TRINITY_DN1580_c0_g1_i9.p1 TRINITY_DN1580_c0_g1~~TRINITY_DN1580_c0_g1_i9.p1  ORF type:complete len:112 (+),score=9.52 TRINITY_DN1580_c0_g1_i9:295-630(+)